MAHVVILGGGYAGVSAARTLARVLASPHRVTLIDRDPYHELTVRLPSVLSGRPPATQVRIPYSRVLPSNVRFVQDTVSHVDLGMRSISCGQSSFTADIVLLCLGRVPDLHAVTGGESTYVFKRVRDVLAIRARLDGLRAERTDVRVTLIGAGYTSTEVAGELLTIGRRSAPSYRLHVSVVADEPVLLPLGNQRLAAVATRMLLKHGVALYLGVDIARVDHDRLTLADGREIASDVTIWGGPSRGGPESSDGQAARFPVDPYLRSSRHDCVYAAGDLAATYDYVADRTVPANAQFAIQEGRTSALNIVAQLDGTRLREFRPHDLGEALDMGDAGACAEVAGRIVTGPAARSIKRAALARYLFSLGGMSLVRECA